MSEDTNDGWVDARDGLAAMGVNVDELVRTDRALQQRAPRDNRICLCGHGVARHTRNERGDLTCQPAKMGCPCKVVRAVIEVEDTRFFLRSTQGGGNMHALYRGMSALAVAGKSFKWITELKCDICKAVDEVLTPVPVTQDGRARSHDTGFHGLLCQSCREEI
jgi:hypothetical protein